MLAALLAGPGVTPSVVTFTGDSVADFANVDTFTLTDAKDIASNSGFDIRSVRFHYDIGSDTAYFGKGECNAWVQTLVVAVSHASPSGMWELGRGGVGWAAAVVPYWLHRSSFPWQAFGASALLVTWTAMVTQQRT